MASISKAGGSTTTPARIIHRPTPIAVNSIEYWISATARVLHGHHGAGEPGHAQAEHREDRPADREIAALARGARRAEECEGQDREGERIDRRHEAVMQFGEELSAQLLEDRIVLVGRNQFPDIAFANPERYVAALREFRHVERVAAERHQRGVALADLESLEVAVLEDQERTVVGLQHRAVVGDDGDALLRIAAVVDEDAAEHAAGLPFADPDGQVLVELGEAAGLQDVGQHVGGDLGVPLLDPAHAVGGEDRRR